MSKTYRHPKTADRSGARAQAATIAKTDRREAKVACQVQAA